jgi:hypothetical protein
VRNELEARGVPLDEATDYVTRAVETALGPGPLDGKLQAVVVDVRK